MIIYNKLQIPSRKQTPAVVHTQADLSCVLHYTLAMCCMTLRLNCVFLTLAQYSVYYLFCNFSQLMQLGLLRRCRALLPASAAAAAVLIAAAAAVRPGAVFQPNRLMASFFKKVPSMRHI